MNQTTVVTELRLEPLEPTPTRTRTKLQQRALERRRKRQLAAIDGFSKTGQLVRTLTELKIDRRTHYRWLRQDPRYAARFEKAREAVADSIEDELIRRARDGWQEPVFNHGTGEVMGHIQRFDSRLMEVAARAWLKDRGYGNEVALSGRVAVETVTRDVGALRQELAGQARALFEVLGPEERVQLLSELGGQKVLEGEVVKGLASVRGGRSCSAPFHWLNEINAL